FTPDSAFVEFPSWIVRNQDSGLNVITYYIPLIDSNPDNNLMSETVFVIGETTGISENQPLLGNSRVASITSRKRLRETIRSRELDDVGVYDATGRQTGIDNLNRGVYFLVLKGDYYQRRKFIVTK
ncbi:MAG: hypothetical protein ABIK47_07530, partial [candidate division WOR-3 bacterium]